jgi:hypothetical protein
MPRFMARQGMRHFNRIAIVRGQEVSAEQEQDDVGFVRVLDDLPPSLLACDDSAVVPERDRHNFTFRYTA